jgi:Fe-S-cluster containining protein
VTGSKQDLAVLEQIIRCYEQWVGELEFACRRGCSACCTRNVTMTGLEGQWMLAAMDPTVEVAYILDCVQGEGPVGRPSMSTNAWARACLEGRELDQDEEQVLLPCPFLDRGGACTIYGFRPFACRCFASTTPCLETGEARQPELLLEINTLCLQLIEHLDQGGRWGNMLDILILAVNENHRAMKGAADERLRQAKNAVRTCTALPGFLVMPELQDEVDRFLTIVLQQAVDGVTIGRILGIAA